MSVSDDDVTFVAAPSEVNRVVVAFEEDPVRGVRVIDIGAALTAGLARLEFVSERGVCRTPILGEIVLALGDQNDSANSVCAPVPDGRAVQLEGGDGTAR